MGKFPPMETAMQRPALPRRTRSRHAATAALAAWGAGLAGAALADTGGLSLGVGVSTLGATLEAAYRMSDTFGMRVPAAYLRGSYTDTDDGIAYDLDLAGGGVGLLGDYYPARGGFRLSGGAFVGSIDADGGARGDGTVGNTAYTGVDLAVGATARNSVMPALALGYDAGIGPGWIVSADLGALYTGGADVAIRDRAGQVAQGDIDAETRKREDDAPAFYPYLKLTVAFRF